MSKTFAESVAELSEASRGVATKSVCDCCGCGLAELVSRGVERYFFKTLCGLCFGGCPAGQPCRYADLTAKP